MNKQNKIFEKSPNIRKTIMLMIFYFLSSAAVFAQLQNIPVTGYNNDLVANGTGATNTISTGSLAGMVTQPAIGVDGVGYTFIDATFKWYSGSTAATCFLPTGGAIPSALTSGLTYQLQDYSSNNALTVVSNTYAGSVWPTTGTVALATPGSFSHIYVLYESVMNTAGPTITATVNFTDATSQVFSGNTLANWFTATNKAYAPFISRVQNVAPGALGACNTGPYLFQLSLPLDISNYSKTVQSISFSWSSAIGAAANTIDYFHVMAVGGNTPCTGTPSPGNTIASSNPVCSGISFTLSLQNPSASGTTFQWQSSPDGTTWTDIAAATNATLATTQTVETYYQCLVTCTAGPSTGTSNPVFVTMSSPSTCYCTPTTTGATTYFITNMLTTGGITNLNNSSGSSAGYQNFFATASMSAMQGNTVNFTMTIAGGSTYGKAIWIDFDQDGIFAAGERVASSTAYASSPISGSFVVPLTATPGITRMRVVATFTPNNPSNPCANTSSGEYEDYAFNVILLPPCTTPSAQPALVSLAAVSTSQINGSFSAAAGPPSGYLVVRYPSPSTEVLPVDGTIYVAGNSLGLGTVLQSSNALSFVNTGLSGGTAYDYYVYSYNALCGGAPYYLTTGSLFGTLSTNSCSSMSGVIPVGPTAPAAPAGFPTLSGVGGALAYIEANGLGGATILELQTDYSTASETLPFTFSSNACINSSKPLTIRPASGVASPFVFSASNTSAVFVFDGGNYITIDGRNGGTGSNKFISIINTSSTAGSAGNAILLRNEASNNTLTYLDLKASNLNPANNAGTVTVGAVPGVVAILSTTGANGNDNNTISNCDIHSATTSTNILNVGIYAYNATTVGNAANNDNNTITNNNIYDWFHATTATAGIDVLVGNNNYIITNNSFYKSSGITYSYTGAAITHRAMWITPNGSSVGSSGFIITGNYIGGTAPLCGGTPYIMTGSNTYLFNGMDISVGNASFTSIQNNIISNINMTTTSTSTNAFVGINIANGDVNIGTVSENIIGSKTTNGAITFATTGNLGGFTGIRTGAGTTINVSNNTVSGIDIAGTATVTPGFNGINGGGGTNVSILNNTIGSLTLANSINATTVYTGTSAQVIRGILVNGGTTSTVTGNTIANMNTNMTATGTAANTVVGISVTVGTSNVTGNLIRNLTSSTQTTSSGGTSAIVGIAYTSTTAPATINGNTIHTLKLTNATVTAGPQITGLFYGGPTSGTNSVSKNSLHSFSVANGNNTATTITGVTVSSGTASFVNNMVRLGYDETGASITAGIQIRGFTKGIAQANNFYNNSVYIGGTGVIASALNSFAFQRSTAPSALPNDMILNNIFVNNRSNAAGSSKHYVFSASANAFLTLNYNDYFFNGTGGLFALNLAADVATYSAGWLASDLNSQSGDPQFINPTGGAALGDLHIHPTNATVIEQNGINIAAVTDDIDGQLRASFTPDDIGADAGNFVGFFCSGPPASATAALTVPGQVCGFVSKTLILTGFSSVPGYTYQWQESATGLPGSFVNVTGGVGGTTSSYSTDLLNAAMYYQCEIGCAFGGSPITSSVAYADILSAPMLAVTPLTGTSVCSGSNVDLTATGATSYAWACNPAYPTVLSPGSTAYPAVSTFITPNNLATVTSRPTSTLASGTGSPPATIATTNWEYKVTGTALNGCTAQSVIYLTVINNPVVPLQLTYTNLPAPVCEPGTPITFAVNNPGTIGAGSWIYNWYDQSGTTLLQTSTNTSSTDSYTPSTPVANGNYIYTVKVSNTVCPSSYAIASPTYFVGYTSLNVVTNANCGDNGVLNVYPEGQTNFSSWYSNNFNTGLQGAAFDALYGNAVISSGLCNITTQSISQNGTLLVRNPAAINTNNLQVDFKLSTAPRGMAFGILGADGLAWSYAPDVWQGQLTPGTGGYQAEGGSGTGFKLAFDATANGAGNTPGCYLMYNCTTPDQGPTSPGVIAFKQGSWWQGLVNAPVSIIISQNGFVTVTVNNQVIFDHVALPAAYLTANKSNWLHAFTARTGGSNELHAIDDLNIRYNTYEYSINSTTGTDGTWQSTNTFNGLSAATYPVWVRNPTNTSCFANTGNVVVGTSPSPSSAITVAASGFGTTVCAGNSTTLTTDVTIPGATFLWESASSIGGPYSPAFGINNAATYVTDALSSNTYFRCTFTCPSSSAVVATPVLVTVNSGSIASTNTPQTINCLGDMATLTATPGPNTTCVWYADAVGGSPLFAGNSYAVTPVSLPVTYYVAPVTTLFTDHYDEGGQKVIANTFGTSIGGTGITTRFTTTSSIRIDSIKVLPTTAGSLTIALQNSGSASNILIYNTTINAGQVGSFINIPVNFSIAGSGNYQLTSSGVSCTYYSSYTGTYAAPYMSLGGVFTIIGGSTSATGATSTSIYGSAFNWSITTSCPAGFGARVPVTVNANPTYLVSVTPSSLPNFCPTTIQPVTASSANAYSSYTWSPVTNLYSDAGATIPLTLSDNQATVYFKAPSAGSNVFTVSTSGSGCTNTATASITVQTALPIVTTATPSAVCSGSNVQLQATVSSASAYCSSTGGTGTYFMNDFSTTGGTTNITNNGSGFSPGGYNYFSSLSVTQAVGSSVNWSASNFSVSDYGVAVFVDWNQNGLFTDAGEQMYSSGVYVLSATGSITVPAGAFNGITRMRVVVDYLNTAPGSCDVSTSHETEDYNFVVTGGIPVVTSYNYDWSVNSTFLSATNISNPVAQAMTSTQTYSVQVTDPSTGCLNTSTVLVTVTDLPQPTASSNSPVCEGQSVSFFGNNLASGQTTGNSYLWSGPNGFNDIVQNPTLSNATSAANGTYTVTVTNQAGCTETITTEVTVAPLPSLNILSQTNVSCNGGFDGEFTIEVTNGVGFYLFDQNGNINFDGIFTGFSAGLYIVQVTDGNSCASSIPVTITEPDPTTTADAGVDQSACTGATVTLAANTALVGTGSWSLISGSGTFTNDTDPATTVTGIGFGVNTYRWTIDNALCFNSNFDDVDVTGTDLPTATISGTQEMCLGGFASLSISFTGTAPWTYSVNGSAPVSTSSNPESVSVTPGTTTVYTITSLSDANCTGSGTGSATVTVTLAPPVSSCTITSLPLDACVGSTVVVSTNVVPGATSYTWSAPSGTLIDGMPSPHTSATNSVNITLGPLATNSSSWLICAFASNACGSTNTNCKPIRGSLSMPSAIVGSTVACPNTGPSTYTTTAVGGASSYVWSITGDASVTGTGLTGSVTFGPTFTSGTLCVRALLPCGYQGPTRCMSIANGTPLLGVMSGTFSVCPGTNGVAYSVPPSAGATTYNWTVPAGATIASGAGTNSITINFGPAYTNGNVCVIAASVCGINSLPRCKTVASDKPGTPGNFTTGAITGVCGQTITYNVNSVSGATGYTWTAPAGATIASANGTNTIDIAFSNSFTTGNVCVTADNGCGSGTPRCVLVKANPSNPGVITGANSVCAFDAGISYSIAPMFGATGYVWTIPSGAAIVSGQGTTSIIVDYGTSGGVIGVTATGTCGNSGTRTLNVSMNCKLSSSVMPDASINAYPNPVSSNLTVELKTTNSGTYTVELLDLSGRIIKSEVMNAVIGLNRNSMDVSTLSKGMYMLNVKNENGFSQQLRIAVE